MSYLPLTMMLSTHRKKMLNSPLIDAPTPFYGWRDSEIKRTMKKKQQIL